MDPKSDDRGEQKEFSNPQDVVFVNTQLILKAMQNVQKAQQDFQAMLEQAELGDTSVQTWACGTLRGTGWTATWFRPPTGSPWRRSPATSGP